MPSEIVTGETTPEGGVENGVDDGYRRLHPITPFLDFINVILRFLLPAAVFVLVSRGVPAEAWIALATIPMTAAAVLRYAFYRYRFAEDEIVVKEGVFNKRERHIPYERIQNIDVSRNLIQRLLGLAEASVETASGTKPEAVFSVLSLSSIEEMRERVQSAKEAVSTSIPAQAGDPRSLTVGAEDDVASEPVFSPDDEEILRLGIGDLLLLGVMSNRSLPFVAGIWGLLWQFDFFESDLFLDFAQRVVRVAPDLVDGMTKTNPLFIALSAFAVLVVLRLLSIAMTFTSLYGFTLTRQFGDLRTQMGMFTRFSSTIPIHRIQALQVRSSLWQRWLRRATIRVETAGSKAGSIAAGRRWIVPLVAEEELAEVLERTQPESSPQNVEWMPLHRHAVTRLMRRQFWIFGVIALPLLIVFRFQALPVFALLPLLLWRARSLGRSMGYGLTTDAVFFRRGWLGRTTTAVRLNKIQAIDLRESPFDRRWEMASLHIDTASSGQANWVRIPFLPAQVAIEIRDQLSLEAGRHAFRW